MGWSRRDPDIPANTSSKPLLSRLFGDEGYVRLPTTSNEGPGAPLPAPTRREEEEGFFARKSRSDFASQSWKLVTRTKFLRGRFSHTR